MKRYFSALAALFIFLPTFSLALVPTDSVLKAHIARRAGDYSQAAEFFRAAIKADPDSVELRLRLARLLLVFGEPDQVLSVLDEGLKRNPDNKDLEFEKAKSLVMAGRNQEGAEMALKAAEHGAGDRAYDMAVRVLAGLEDYPRALATAEKWLAGKPENPADAHAALGSVYFKMNDLQKASAEFEKVLALKPDNPMALEAMAGLALQLGDGPRALKLYRKLIDLNPHQLEARLTVAQLHLSVGEREEALKVLSEAEQWVGQNVGAYLRLGLLYVQAESPEKGLAVLERIPDSHKDDRAWFYRGIALLELKQNAEAVAAFEKVQPASPLHDEAVVRRSFALKADGKKEEAVSDLKAHHEKDRSKVDIMLSLVSLLSSLERNREALEILEGYHKANPDHKSTNIMFNLGVLYDKTGDWEKTVEFMKKVLQASPDDAHALNYLGYSYAEKEVNLGEAEKMVEKAARLLPQNGYIIDSLGWVYYKQGRFKDAVRELERAAALSPDDATIWEHLGDARKKARDIEGAAKAYEKALGLAPENAGVKKKLEETR